MQPWNVGSVGSWSYQRYSMLAVCPQYCPVPSPEGVRLHTLSYPMSTSGIFLLPLIKSAERSGAVQELHQLRSAPAETCPGKDGQAAQDQAPQDVNKRHPLFTHVFLVTNRDLRHNVGIPEEVQPATSDTTWVYLRNRRTTNCVSDLGQVTLKGNVQTEDPLKV